MWVLGPWGPSLEDELTWNLRAFPVFRKAQGLPITRERLRFIPGPDLLYPVKNSGMNHPGAARGEMKLKLGDDLLLDLYLCLGWAGFRSVAGDGERLDINCHILDLHRH